MAYGNQLNLKEAIKKIQTGEEHDSQPMLKEAFLAVMEERSKKYEEGKIFSNSKNDNAITTWSNWCGLAYRIKNGSITAIACESNRNDHSEKIAIREMIEKYNMDEDTFCNAIKDKNQLEIVLFTERSPCDYGNEIGCEPYLRKLGIPDSNVYFAVNMEIDRTYGDNKTYKNSGAINWELANFLNATVPIYKSTSSLSPFDSSSSSSSSAPPPDPSQKYEDINSIFQESGSETEEHIDLQLPADQGSGSEAGSSSSSQSDSNSENQEHIDLELLANQESDSEAHSSGSSQNDTGIQTEEVKEPVNKRQKTKDHYVQNSVALAASRDKQDSDTDLSSDTSSKCENSSSSFS